MRLTVFLLKLSFSKRLPLLVRNAFLSFFCLFDFPRSGKTVLQASTSLVMSFFWQKDEYISRIDRLMTSATGQIGLRLHKQNLIRLQIILTVFVAASIVFGVGF